MGRKKPVILPSRTFETQDECKGFFSEMLNRYDIEEIVDEEDSRLLYELLLRHPEAEQKVGCGILHFYVMQSPVYPTKGFHIQRVDDSSTDFALKACVSGQAYTLEQEFYIACRHSVQEELRMQKQQLFDETADRLLPCANTGEMVGIHECDYRHTHPPFKEIVQRFIEHKQLVLEEVALSVGGDMQYTTTFEDVDLENDFKEFHSRHAKLAIFRKGERP